MSEDEQDKIFTQISSSFFNEEGNYTNIIESRVANFKKQQGLNKLHNIWKKKTSTDSPKSWSLQYRMPIMLMIEDDEADHWHRIFEILNSSSPDDKQIAEGLKALEEANIWDTLADESARDKAFIDKILKDNAIVLDDVAEVKDVLMSHLSSNPYVWLSMPQLGTVIEKFVRDKYLKGRYSLAMDRIDNMDAESVKKYLKDLIKNNPTVGIQIIKTK